MARVLREISFDALQIHGALGTTNLTPLQDMYAAAPTMGIADGADEVHKATLARRILKGYRPHEGNFPREFIPYKKDKPGGRCSQALRPRIENATAGLPSIKPTPVALF